MEKLSPAQQNGPEYAELTSQLDSIWREMVPINNAFINAHLNSYVSWDMVTQKSIISNPDEQKELLYKFSNKFLKSADGKRAIEAVNKVFKTAIGHPAPGFVQNDPTGNPVSLASLKGKYVLIDFWASWCGPCRAENPNVKLAYDKFKFKNFEILAVSLDSKKKDWVKAIADDKLPWLHVSDLKGWNNVVASLYNVSAVPQNWLLDPTGKIIATNMRGKELELKLHELIK